MDCRRLPLPGPSYIKEERVRLRADGREIALGMAAPNETEDGWWMCVLWGRDEGGVVDTREIAPRSGPPPDPPLMVLGPLFAGALSGLVAQEDGRQALRLRLPPASDESRPWERPLVVQVALKWEPLRASTMTRNALAREALRAFARAVESAGGPGPT